MVGQPEAISATADGRVIEVARGKKGASIINISTDKVKLKIATSLPDGTYRDKVYHKKFKNRWHLKDVQCEYISADKNEALLNELNCNKDAFLEQAEEQKKTVFYANLREKGAYTLAPEGTEIEITGKFDPKELTLLEYEMMEEGVNGDDFLSGVIAVDYDGQICPLMIDGDVFGINDWAVITPDEGLAFSSMDDD